MKMNAKFKKISITLLLLPFSFTLSSLSFAETEQKVNSDKVRFVVTGDTGTGARGQYDVSKAMEQKCKKDGCDFGIIVGDNIYNDGVKNVDDPQFISKFENPYKNLDFKFYMTLGNHDYRGNVQAQIEYTTKSKKWVMPSNIYHFNKGIADFFSIDTNIPSDNQAKEIRQDLRNSEAKWKIVFGHHPRYTNGLHGNPGTKLSKMLDKSLCGKADLYIAGHEHNKEHLKPVCGVEYLIVGSGAGLRLMGRGQNTLFGASTLGFAWFEVDNEKIHFQILDKDNRVEYEYTIKK